MFYSTTYSESPCSSTKKRLTKMAKPKPLGTVIELSLSTMSKKVSDQELIRNYMTGDQESVSILIERHRARVMNYIMIMVHSRDMAEDVFQETYIKVLRFLDAGRYSENGKFVSWVMRIAHNQVIDHFRQAKYMKTVTEADTGYNILNTKEFSSETIEDNLISEQITKDIRKLIEMLPDEQREVVFLRYYENKTFQEIADMTGVSINTALGRMRYALINLRKMIKENAIHLT